MCCAHRRHGLRPDSTHLKDGNEPTHVCKAFLGPHSICCTVRSKMYTLSEQMLCSTSCTVLLSCHGGGMHMTHDGCAQLLRMGQWIISRGFGTSDKLKCSTSWDMSLVRGTVSWEQLSRQDSFRLLTSHFRISCKLQADGMKRSTHYGSSCIEMCTWSTTSSQQP